VRSVREVVVFSRTASRREGFADRVERELGIPARATASADEAVAGRDIVVLATTTPTPVISADVLSPGTHVTTVGSKQRGRAEFDLNLAERAATIITDSIAQAVAYRSAMLLAGTRHADRMRALGAVLAGAAPGRRGRDEVTLFCSVGLAGTEVCLLERLAGPGSADGAGG
jgi:alanine dehydrogenase